MRVSLDHAHIFASDAAATLEFFETMLGATAVWDEVVAGVRGIRLQLGRAFISGPTIRCGRPLHSGLRPPFCSR